MEIRLSPLGEYLIFINNPKHQALRFLGLRIALPKHVPLLRERASASGREKEVS